MLNGGEFQMDPILISLQVHSVREDFANNPEETLRKIARIGYRGVEFDFGAFTESAEFYANAIEKAGLQCVSLMVGHHLLDPESISRVIAFCKTLRCDTLVIGALDWPRLEADPDFRFPMLDQIKTAAATIRAAGLETGFHNHAGDFTTKFDGVTLFEFLFDNMDDDFMLMMDTGNCMAGGGDPIAMVKKFPHRSRIAHFKGYSEKGGYLTTLWDSDIDNDSLLRTLIELGDSNILTVEFGRRGDYIPMERAKESFDWLYGQLKTRNLV